MVVGLIGIKGLISHRIFFVCLIAAIILSLAAWREAAKQEYIVTQRDLQNSNLRNNLEKIASSLNMSSSESAQALAKEILNRIGDRIVSPSTAEKIIQDLKAAGSFQVTVRRGGPDSEIAQFSSQMEQILKLSGWQVHGPIISMASSGVQGIYVVVNDNDKPPVSARILLAILQKHGITVTPDVNPNLAKDTDAVILYIGRK